MNSETNENEEIRLNKYLAASGLGARRKCDELITGGHIFVNGDKVTQLGSKINPDTDVIEYHGKKIVPVKKLEYIAFNKPRGVVVTKLDPEGRSTVYDSLKHSGHNFDHLNYVGRLDFNSEGLLLLTNDGEMIHALTHPRYKIKKVYHVKIDRKLESEEIESLLEGVESEGQLLKAGAVSEISEYEPDRKQFWYEIVLYEGKNRQIRRMLEALGVLIGKLRRVQFASVKLGTLESFQYRHLTDKEIAALKSAGYKPTK
jgi:pseudouridine synthase